MNNTEDCGNTAFWLAFESESELGLGDQKEHILALLWNSFGYRSE
jgi:hypothetical protein